MATTQALDLFFDAVLWAIDHKTDSREDVRRSADDLLNSVNRRLLEDDMVEALREHNRRWHVERQRNDQRVIDLTDVTPLVLPSTLRD